jgi:hypothetical protein
VELEITPEASEEERAAIAEALDAAEAPQPGSAWWQAGLLESLEAPDDR